MAVVWLTESVSLTVTVEGPAAGSLARGREEVHPGVRAAEAGGTADDRGGHDETDDLAGAGRLLGRLGGLHGTGRHGCVRIRGGRLGVTGTDAERGAACGCWPA